MNITQTIQYTVTFDSVESAGAISAAHYKFDSEQDFLQAQAIAIAYMNWPGAGRGVNGTPHKVRAIKALRSMYGWGLKEAKDWIELMDAHVKLYDHAPGISIHDEPADYPRGWEQTGDMRPDHWQE